MQPQPDYYEKAAKRFKRAVEFAVLTTAGTNKKPARFLVGKPLYIYLASSLFPDGPSSLFGVQMIVDPQSADVFAMGVPVVVEPEFGPIDFDVEYTDR